MVQGLWRNLIVPQALSRRERECVVGFVEEGHSRREAARIFKTAASTTVRIMRRFRETGSVPARVAVSVMASCRSTETLS